MKNLIIGLAAVLLMGGGTYAMVNMVNEEEPKEVTTSSESENEESETPTDEESEAPEEETEEPKEVPASRTSDIGSSYPWEVYGADITVSKHQAGETVFLLSDAEALENMLQSFSADPMIELDDEDKNAFNITKASMAESNANYLNAFITEVEKSYDNEEYFAKLREVESALRANDYEATQTLINEAKSLR